MRGGMTRACPMLQVVVGCPCRYARACFVITLVAMSLFPLKLKMPDHRYRHYNIWKHVFLLFTYGFMV